MAWQPSVAQMSSQTSTCAIIQLGFSFRAPAEVGSWQVVSICVAMVGTNFAIEVIPALRLRVG